MINILKTDDNILTLSIDGKPGQPNLISEAFLTHLETLVEVITRDNTTLGLIFTSQRSDFLSGADLELFRSKEKSEDFYKVSRKLQNILREIEKWERPVVAAINGHALGGGLELALACNYRVAINHQKLKVGLPEVKLGLMPGGGGTQRLPRLIGIEKAMPLILEGKALSVSQARAIGILDDLADNQEELLEKARAFIEQNPHAKQPWDLKESHPDPHCPRSERGYNFFTAASALVEKNFRGKGDGPAKILSAIYEGSLLPIDQACEVEAIYFGELLNSTSSKNMLDTLFYGINKCESKGKTMVKDLEEIKQVGVIGAGIMGQGIAQVCAAKGIEVLLMDKDLTTAEMGVNQISKKVEKEVKREHLSIEDSKLLMARIKTISEYDLLSNCDLVIEAATENLDLKRKIFKELEEHIKEECVLATNTSSLPIQQVTTGLQRPERVLGLHFFSPVPRMKLVEVIKAKATNQESLLKGLKLVHSLHKTPIIVRDGLGFFTTRVFMRYITEALKLLSEGVSPALIENAGKELGFPLGPLEIADEVSLELIKNLLEEKARLENVHTFRDPSENRTREIVTRFITKYERLGKKNRKGFYDYPQERPKKISPQTYDEAKNSQHKEDSSQVGLPNYPAIKERLHLIQMVETLKCFEQGILNTAHEGDVASLLGWGYPAYTGGVVKECDKSGHEDLMKRLIDLQQAWGERFTPPKILKTLLNKGYSSLYEAREIFSNPLLIEKSND